MRPLVRFTPNFAALVAAALVGGMLLVGCAPTTSMTTERVLLRELAGYRYVVIPTITQDDGQRDPYGVEPRLREGLAGIGFRPITAGQVQALESSEVARVLFAYVAYNWSPNALGSVATLRLDFHDILNRQVLSVTGTGQSFSYAADIRIATQGALDEVTARHPGYNAAVQPEAARILASWPRVALEEETFRSQLEDSSALLDPVEGVWVDSEQMYRLAIRAVSQQGRDEFQGIVLEANHPLWGADMVKMELERTATVGAYSATYWAGGLERIGSTAFLQDGALSIDLRLPDGTTITSVFVKVFPDVRSQAVETNQETVMTGSGFLVSPTGIVATNAHVVDGSSDIQVAIGKPRTVYNATVITIDRSNDLALLALDDFDFDEVFSASIPYALVGDRLTSVGDTVLAVGYPVSSILGGEIRVTDGIVSAKSGIGGSPNVLQVTNAVQPGNSGGPLFDVYGDVVGVVVSTVNAAAFLEVAGTLPQNINFAVKGSYLASLLNVTNRPSLSSEPSGRVALPARDIVNRSSSYVATIEAQ